MSNDWGRMYTDIGGVLRSVVIRDLGMHVHSIQKMAKQINGVLKKAFGILTSIGSSILYKSRSVML